MSVVACPKCAEKVSLPEKTPGAAKVRCPLCSATYELSEALAAVPPMLEVVELPEGYEEFAAIVHDKPGYVVGYEEERIVPDSDSVPLSFETPKDESLPLGVSSFTDTIDRPSPIDDDEGTDFRLEGDNTGEADDGAEPRYDQWGPTRSSASTAVVPTEEARSTESVRPTVSSQRRKKKGTNPLFHVAGIILGGALAFPAAFLILLWLPGSLQRDPVGLGPILGEHAPFLVPAEFRNPSSGTSEVAAPTPSPPSPSPKDNPRSTTPSAVSQTPSGGNRIIADAPPDPERGFDPLANDNDPLADPFAEPSTPSIEFPAFPGDEPSLDPLESRSGKPVIDPDLDPDLAPSDDDPIPAPTLERPIDDPDFPPLDPDEPASPMPVADPVAAARTELERANEAFEEASSAEKAAAAKSLVEAANELAEQLPRDSVNAPGFEMFLDDNVKWQVAGRLAAGRFDVEDPSGGIVLAGTVVDSKQAGERHELTIELPTRDKRQVTVVSPLEVKAGITAFIAGRLTSNAKDMIGGYEGDATKAVDARVIHILGAGG
jgi:hypothetical protein